MFTWSRTGRIQTLSTNCCMYPSNLGTQHAYAYYIHITSFFNVMKKKKIPSGRSLGKSGSQQTKNTLRCAKILFYYQRLGLLGITWRLWLEQGVCCDQTFLNWKFLEWVSINRTIITNAILRLYTFRYMRDSKDLKHLEERNIHCTSNLKSYTKFTGATRELVLMWKIYLYAFKV